MIKLPDSKLNNKMINDWNNSSLSDYANLDQRTKDYMKMYINQYITHCEKNHGFVNKNILAKIVMISQKIEGIKL